MKIIKKNIKKYLKNNFFKAKFIYTKYYQKNTIKDNEILLQSYDGSSISGNAYYILLELCENKKYKELKKYIVSKEKNYEEIKKIIIEKNLNNVEIIKLHSKKYCKKLAEVKYLINNSTFPTYFIKKEGQIYLNTWHGTPLKGMGRKIKNAPNELGNTQRNFLMADYLLNPNEFTFKHMKEDYMLDNLYKGEYIISGYPRNSAFYNNEQKEEIRKNLKIEGKKIVVYMPTWRGNLKNKKNDKQFVYTMHMLYELDKKIDEKTIIYVKLHNYVSNLIDYSIFNKIKPFPEEYETYEFLNIADCLITDYSSVLFDYANTGKKIILYAYDKEEYLKDRGMYLNYDKLPFCHVNNIEELSKEIEHIDEFEKYTEFNNDYNKYENGNTPQILCDYIFQNKKNSNMKIIKGEYYNNNKNNILIFGGSLAKNGITTALKGLINNVDKNSYNYFLSFYKNKVEEEKNVINEFDKIDYIPIQGQKDVTISEAVCQYLYFRLNISNAYIDKKLKDIYQRECKRIYPNIKFDYVIHYSGYEKQIMNLFRYMDAKKIIYLHNDMQNEIKLKNNIHEKSFKKALMNFDKIVAIRETSKNEIIKYYPKIDERKVIVAHNLNNIEDILEKSMQNIEFDESTYSNISIKELNKILNDDKIKKFINIARFSPEKGQGRLISAFLKYREECDKNAYLIIIGGNRN